MTRSATEEGDGEKKLLERSMFVSLTLQIHFIHVLLFDWQVDASHRKEAMKVMTETFYAALFGYDEVRHT